MIRIQNNLIAAIFCLWPMMVMGQDADFEIRNFRERTTDLSAISSNYKDLNGNPAALIRFVVRDPQFEFEANLGVIAMKRKTGEVYLYVPQDTRRLTVRHPRLGVLKDYAIPIRIRSKVTYDADIVITETNLSEQGPYDIGIQEQPIPPAQPEPLPDTTYKSEHSAFNAYAGVGFNAISVMGPSILLGVSYADFHLEAGYVLGLDKVENIAFTQSGVSSPSEAYDYSCSKLQVRVGYNFNSSAFQVSPQAGVTFNMISGKATGTASNKTDYFKECYPMSLSVGVRFSYKVADHLRIHLTPQYDFNLGGDKIFDFIKDSDSKLKSFGEGFGINAGVIYEF